jgi:hypothetical protein
MRDGEMPNVAEPLDKWVEKLLDAALIRHSRWCLAHGPGADLTRLRLRFALLIGFMIGSGLLGGAAGAAVMKCLIGG